LACHLQIEVDPGPVLVYNFDADPDPDFYLMRMRIQVTKKDAYQCESASTTLLDPQPRISLLLLT
jgi:hypothetical protein